MISLDVLKTTIEAGIENSEVEVIDLTGTNDHFQVRVVSNAFAGKSAIQRHRMVYDLFGNDVGNAIHALSIKALTVDEAA